MTELLQELIELARRELDLAAEIELSESTRLVEDLELDSVKLLTLAVEVENHYRILLEPEDEAQISSLGDLARIVARKCRQSAVESDQT
jgi:acyl carrier protein